MEDLVNHPDFYDPDFKRKRVDPLVSTVINSYSPFLNMYYCVQYDGEKKLYPLENEGFMLLPKHQSNLDILLEGMMLKKFIRRHANYVMKGSLPGSFEYLGGISVTRLKDIKKSLKIEGMEGDKGAKIEALAGANKMNESAENIMLNLLARKEIIVSHIEGRRNYHKNSKINFGNVANLIGLQKRLGKQITFVPLGIEYENIRQFNSIIKMKVGNPIRVFDDGLDVLVEHLANEVNLLHV